MNNNHILVVEYDDSLFNEIEGYNLVVKIDNLSNIHNIADSSKNKNSLHAILYENYFQTIASIDIDRSWNEMPLVFCLNSLGNFKNFVLQLPIIKTLNISFFFKCNNEDNFINLRILSSLNINCGLVLDQSLIHWELLLDLLTHSLYSKSKHKIIEPFKYIITNYKPQEYVDYSYVYFNDPRRFLHIDKKMNIALTHLDLVSGNFVGNGTNDINNIEKNETYKEKMTAWQDYFLSINECSTCPAWRICLGKFDKANNKNDTCKRVFSEVFDALEMRNSNLSKQENAHNNI